MNNLAAEPTMVLCEILRTDGGCPQVLLGRKKRGFGTGKFIGPGGHIEPGETPRQATVREVREETGLIIDPRDLTESALLDFRFPYRTEWSTVVAVFATEVFTGLPQESDELNPLWFGIDALPLAQMWDDDNYWLAKALGGQRLHGVFHYGPDNATVASAELTPLPAGILGD